MREQIFNGEIVSSLMRAGAWAYKIPDMVSSGMTRFTPPKPCDIVASYRGRLIAIEGKQMKKLAPFGFKLLRPAQVFHLNAVAKSGGLAFVFLNLRLPQDNRLVIIPWGEVKDIETDGPIGREALMERPFIEGGGGRFDLGPWLSWETRGA